MVASWRLYHIIFTLLKTEIVPLRYDIIVKKSKIAGRGAFALQDIPAKRKIGNMSGQIISFRKARHRVKLHPKKAILMVEFDNAPIALDASINRNELSYINHSCRPNTFLRRAYRRVEFYSLRPIAKGEELSCNYGATHHNGKLPCKCGAPNCKGFI
jgi:SET domain-containing protein